MTNEQSSPAGWHVIPNDPNTERYYDGTQWTDQYRPLGAAPAPPTAPQQPGPPGTQRPLWKKKRFFIPVGALGALVLLGAFLPASEEPDPEKVTASTTATTEPASASEAQDDDSADGDAPETSSTTEPAAEPEETTTTAAVIGADGAPLRVNVGEVASTSMSIVLPARKNESACELQVPIAVRALEITITNSTGASAGTPSSLDAFGKWINETCVARFAVVTEPALLTNALSVIVGDESFDLSIEEVFSGRETGPDHVLNLAAVFDDPQPFGKGTLLVGIDLEAGVYTIDPGSSCYWERLSGVSGDFDEIITNGNASDRTVVAIVESDFAFNSGCGLWLPFVPSTTPARSFSAGDWQVGGDIEPGLYRSDGQQGCYWERASGFGHGFGEILANDNIEGPGIVEIKKSDDRFSAGSGCGTWTKTE